MKPKKEPYISDKMQKVAVDILERLMFVKSLDELGEVFKYTYKKYKLCDDPFTHMPCTTKEYVKLSYSYDKQKAEEMYGHSDWF